MHFGICLKSTLATGVDLICQHGWGVVYMCGMLCCDYTSSKPCNQANANIKTAVTFRISRISQTHFI